MIKPHLPRSTGEPKAAASPLAPQLASLAFALLLSGCGTSIVHQTGGAIAPAASPHLHGSAHGGQQPVVSASIQLYEVGTSGYGSPSKHLLAVPSPITTDAQGQFNITGDYTCDAGALVYITATGGNPGLAYANPNLALMTALGPCSSLSPSTSIEINEVTTVASIYALSPFMGGSKAIGSTPTNLLGITQAFADVNELVDTSTGIAPGPALPAGASFSVAELNSLANSLAACVNSYGSYDPNGACANLFEATIPNLEFSSTPPDTLMAMMYIAQTPGLNVQPIFDVAAPQPPFQPTLATAPNDWTLAVTYTAGGMSAPSSLAVDASGNVWIANRLGNTVSELSHAGVPVSGSPYFGSLDAPTAIALDQNGLPWVANSGNASLVFFSNGAASPPRIVEGGGLSGPSAIALDAKGNIWASDGNADLVSEFNGSQSPVTTTGFGPSGLVKPLGIAISPQ